MADEHDAWLDKDAAERLLRGEQVEALDDGIRGRTELLSEALRDMASVTYANGTNAGELPGEAAALAAFRQSAAARGSAVGRTSGPGAAVQDLLGTVRLTLAPPPGPGGPGGARRRAPGALVVGCALGGVAVAAAVGMIPALFSPATGGAPAHSVSAATSPDREVAAAAEAGDASRGGGGRRESAEGTGGTGVAGDADVPVPGAGGSSGRTSAPSGNDSRTGKSGKSGKAEKSGAADEARPGAVDVPIGPSGRHRDRPGPGADAEARRWYRENAKVCRVYRSGALDRARKQALETAADGPRGAALFCAGLLDDPATGTGTGTGGGRGGDRNGPGEDRGGGGEGEGEGAPGGPGPAPPGPPNHPSIRPSDSPPPSAPEPVSATPSGPLPEGSPEDARGGDPGGMPDVPEDSWPLPSVRPV